MIDNVFASFIMQNEMDKEEFQKRLRAVDNEYQLARLLEEAVSSSLISYEEACMIAKEFVQNI